MSKTVSDLEELNVIREKYIIAEQRDIRKVREQQSEGTTQSCVLRFPFSGKRKYQDLEKALREGFCDISRALKNNEENISKISEREHLMQRIQNMQKAPKPKQD